MLSLMSSIIKEEECDNLIPSNIKEEDYDNPEDEVRNGFLGGTSIEAISQEEINSSKQCK